LQPCLQFQARTSGVVTADITAGGGHSWVADDEVIWAFFSHYARAENGKLLKLPRSMNALKWRLLLMM
jgi:hypothetical protein